MPWLEGEDGLEVAGVHELPDQDGQALASSSRRDSSPARARLRDWMSLAPEAEETLRAAAGGELRFQSVGARERPEMLRSAVKSAIEVLDRALGTTKQMHEHKAQGGIIVAVAGPSQMPTTELEPGPFGNGHGGALPPA